MGGSEQLEVGRLGGGQRRLVAPVVALAVLVVVGLGVLRLTGVGRADEPRFTNRSLPTTSTTSAARPARRDWPTGIASGTVWLVAAGTVYAIDASTGLVTRTSVTRDPGAASVTSFGGGVLVWSEEDGTKDVLPFPESVSYPVPDAVSRAHTLLPGPDGNIWATTTASSGSSRPTTWQLLDPDGDRVAEVEVEVALALADGAGGLLSETQRGLRRVYPRSGPVLPVIPLAAGVDGTLVERCIGGGCRNELEPRTSGAQRTVHVRLPDQTAEGLLSPGNELVASVGLADDEGRVDVASLDSGRVRRSFATHYSDGQIAWLSDRWLMLISEDQIVLYDAVADTVVRPDLALGGLEQLVWQPA